MARRVFFSFHYQRDIWRVNQIRSLPNVVGTAAAGFQDASLWEKARKEGDVAIKRLINAGLIDTTVTVVFVGAQTASRRYVNYEIKQSLARGNGLVAVQIHHLQNQDKEIDAPGAIPAGIKDNGFKAYRYVDAELLAKWIEEAATIAAQKE
ncbi:MAG: TIR domain-containing protein [Planctomycetota bacterium]